MKNADRSVYPLTLYYEAACALCNGEMTNLMLRNTGGLLKFVDVSAPDFKDLPPGTTLKDLMELIHAKKGDGTVIRGVEVFRLAYEAVGLGWVGGLLKVTPLKRLAELGYPMLARNRHRIPRWISHAVFETAIRRAAERAASHRCQPGKACER